jgi:hypothetical protein
VTAVRDLPKGYLRCTSKENILGTVCYQL